MIGNYAKISRSRNNNLLQKSNNKNALLFCLIAVVVFCSLSNAGNSQRSLNAFENQRCSFGFEKTVLKEADIKDSRSAIDYWILEIGKVVNMRIEGYIFDDFKSLMAKIKNGEIDVANISPVSYLRNKEKLDLVPGFAPLMGGKKTRKYLLIVHADSSISEIKDLNGKKVAVLKGNEVGKIYLNILLLRKIKKEAENFFSSITEKDKYSQVILSVFFGQSDAGIATESSFKTMVELNPQIGKRLKIIAESPEVINMISFFNKNYNKELKEYVMGGILTLGTIPHGSQIMLSFKVDGFVPAVESDLESLDVLLKEYKELKGSD